MIDCREAQMLVSCRLDGEEGPGEARQLTEHLAACAACRSLLAVEIDARDALRSALHVDAADLDALGARIVAVTGSGADGVSSLRRSPRWMLPLSLAAGFLLGFGLWILVGGSIRGALGGGGTLPGANPNPLAPTVAVEPEPEEPAARAESPEKRLFVHERREDDRRAIDGDPGALLQTRRDRMDIIDYLESGDDQPPLEMHLELERLERQLYRRVNGSWH